MAGHPSLPEHLYRRAATAPVADAAVVAVPAFFTGTAAEVLPIRELDGRVIGAGKRGPVTEKLQAMYFDAVKGKLAEHSGWLTHVKG